MSGVERAVGPLDTGHACLVVYPIHRALDVARGARSYPLVDAATAVQLVRHATRRNVEWARTCVTKVMRSRPGYRVAISAKGFADGVIVQRTAIAERDGDS